MMSFIQDVVKWTTDFIRMALKTTTSPPNYSSNYFFGNATRAITLTPSIARAQLGPSTAPIPKAVMNSYTLRFETSKE